MHGPSRESRGLGAALDTKLGGMCEQRLGQIVHAAATLDLRRFSCPAGSLKPRKAERMVVALTDEEVWLLELRYRVMGFMVGVPLCQLPRRVLVANWRRRRFRWPAAWQAEFCWPYQAVFIEGDLVDAEDAERIMGLLTADELDRELGLAAPAPE
jgi:hypothetical protein